MGRFGIAALLVAGTGVALLWTRPWQVMSEGRGEPRPGDASPELAKDSDLEGGSSETFDRTGALQRRGVRPQPADALPEPVDLAAVDRSLDLHGTVVDGTAAPVAGAELVTVTYPFRRAEILAFDRDDEAVFGPRTRSARDGTFALRLPRGASVGLRVTAKGFPPIERPGCRAGERVTVVLKSGVTLVIEAVDEAGKPAAGAAFRLFRGNRGDVTFSRKGVAGADGRLRLEGLPSGATAWLDSEASRFGDFGWRDVALPASGELTMRVEVSEGRTLTGRVTDAQTHVPLAGARIGMNWTLHRATTTDADGRYALQGWTGNGIHDLHVLAAGYGRGQAIVGAATVLDFALERADAVVGRVLTSDGTPLPSATLGIVGSERVDGLQVISTASGSSGPDGRFRIDGLRHDMPHALVAMAPGFGRTLTDFDPAASRGGVIDVGDVRLSVSRALTGRVRTFDGAPVPGARVELRGANADRSRLRPAGKVMVDSYGSMEDGATDDLGRFAFPDLAPGTYEVNVASKGMPPQKATVVVPTDEDPAELLVTFPAGRLFRIVVVDSDGKPIPWAWFLVVGTGPVGSHAQTLDGDGGASFLLSSTATAVRVLCFGDESDPRRFLPVLRDFPIDPQADLLRSIMTRGSAIRGRVLGPDGAAIPFAGLHVMAGGESFAREHADDQGRFDVTVPIEGTSTLRLDGTAWLEVGGKSTDLGLSGEITGLKPGSNDVILSAHARRTDRRQVVRVLDPEGHPLAGLKVSAAWADGAFKSAEVLTSSSGSAELSALPDSPCAWTVTGWPADSGWLAPAYDQNVPSAEPLELRLRRGLRLRGRVTAPTGVDVTSTRVIVRQRDGPGATSSVSGPDHSFTLLLDPVLGETGEVQAILGPEGAITHRKTLDGVRLDGGDVVLALEPVK